MAAIISAFVASLIAVLTASMVEMAMSPPTGCATRLVVLLSPCLPFISSPPNNLSATVPPACCKALSSVYDSTRCICLCYFLRDPYMLGFPLNSSKVIALPSVCPINGRMNLEMNTSLESLCAGSQTLPPLLISRIPGIDEPDSPADENTPAPVVALPPSRTIVTPSTPVAKSPPSPSSATPKGLTLTKYCIGLFLSASSIHISTLVFSTLYV